MPEPCISVILPCYNEAENLEEVVTELESVLTQVNQTFEVILVDDHSTDNSPTIVHMLQKTRPHLRLFIHKKNFGQSAAFMTGFQNAKGKILITLDADQQYDVSDIPHFLEALKDCDAVCGIRQKRKDSWEKIVSSRIANGVRNWILKDGIHDAGCTFRAFHKKALVHLIPFQGMHRFFPMLLKSQGAHVKEIMVQHRPRAKGQTKYGMWDRLGVGIWDTFAMLWYRKRGFPADRL